MKKIIKIIFIAALSQLLLRVVNDVIILNIGTIRIDSNGYPKFLIYILGVFNLFIYFFSVYKIYPLVINQKNKYWKLFICTFSIGITFYLLHYIYQFIIFKFFPYFDANVIAYKDFGFLYNGPNFHPINDLLIHPFVQLYYYISGFILFDLHVISFFFGETIFLSFLIPYIIILFMNKKIDRQ